jgi:hypothetical protein
MNSYYTSRTGQNRTNKLTSIQYQDSLTIKFGSVATTKRSMDALEDSWWPNSVNSSHPFTLPLSSQWLQRQDGRFLIIRAGGDPVEYRTHINCMPFLMLLDMVQLTYLRMSNSGDVNQQELFYKGVVFLDFLRGEFLSAIRNLPNPPDFKAQASSVPEGMQRWLCRLLHRIPHDPRNRKHHAQLLNKLYLEVDVFKYGATIFDFDFDLYITCSGGTQTFWAGHLHMKKNSSAA